MSDGGIPVEQSISINEQPAKKEGQKLQTSTTQETPVETKTENKRISEKIYAGERILQTTFKELAALFTTLWPPEAKTINVPSLQEEQLQSISSEELAQKLQDIEKQAQDIVSSYQNSLTFARNMNNSLDKISPQSEKNLQELNTTLEKINEALKSTRQVKKEKLPLLEKQAKILHTHYLAKKLEEAGFASKRELDDQRDDLIMAIGGLKDQIKRQGNKFVGIGRWLNRNQIQEKESLLIQKQDKLQSLSSLQNLLRQPFTFASIEEMWDQKQIVGFDTVEKIAGKIQDWYITLIEENKHETIILPENVLDSLNISQSQESVNSQYNRIAQFIKNVPYYEIVKSYHSYINQLERLSNQFYIPQKVSNKLYDTKHNIQPSIQEVDEFVIDFNQKNWNIFRQNKTIQRFFQENTTHAIEKADWYLGLQIAHLLVNQNAGADKSVELGYKLLEFTHEDIIPLVVMNAYRESGHSGERPFLYITAHSEDTLLFKYINALDHQQVENLAKQNIPGLTEIIRLIKDNPHNFNSIYTEYPQPNPVYQQIQNHLLEMGLYYLKNKQDTRLFAIKLLSHIDNIDLKDGYQILSSLLEQSQDDPLKKAILTFWQRRNSDFYTHLQNLTFDKSTFALLCLRETDPLLKNIPPAQKTVTEEIKNKFYNGLQFLTQSMSTKDQETQDLYFNDDVLYFLSRQPERVNELVSLSIACPNLFKLMSIDGPLHSNKYLIIKNIFANGDMLRKAKEIERVFSPKTPYWRQLFTFTDVRIGEQLAASISAYPIDSISNIPLFHLIAQHQNAKAKNPDITTRLESIVAGNQNIIDALSQGTQNTIPFSALAGIYKRIVFRDYVRKTIETSQSEMAKQKAHQRNSNNAPLQLELFPEMLIHGSPVDCLDNVLINGNLPKEALGEGATTDSYPFHIDFSRITQELIDKHQSTDEVILNTISNNFGVGGKSGVSGQLFYLYKRDTTDWETGRKYSAQGNENHGLMLGGIPSTEISAVIVRDPDVTLSLVRTAIIDHGFYIPCYNIEGKLLFTPQQYESLIKKAKPYETIYDFLRDDSYLNHLDKPQASSLHKFNLKEHLLKTTEKARELCKYNNLSDEATYLVLLAARLHDVGKGTENINTNQWFDNPTAAVDYLKKIRSLSVAQQQEVLYLIQHDELIGDILQGKKDKQELFHLFPTERDRKMLLALYQADVLEIDGTGDVYRMWKVEEKLKELGLT